MLLTATCFLYLLWPGGDTSPLPPEDSDEYDPEADEDDGELLEEEIDFVRVPASDDEETLDIRSQLDGAADSEVRMKFVRTLAIFSES